MNKQQRILEQQGILERNQEVCSRYLAGDSIDTLAEVYNLSKIYIYKLCKENEDCRNRLISERKEYLLGKRNQDICSRYLSGDSIHMLAEIYGLSEQRIYAICLGNEDCRNRLISERKRREPLVNIRDQEIYSKYLSGDSICKLAEIYDLSKQRIYQICTKNKERRERVKRKRTSVITNEQVILQISELVDQGISIREIAVRLGYSYYAVYRTIRDRGIVLPINKIPVGYRRCCDCHEIKSLDLFGNVKNNSSGKSYRCKRCNVANARKYAKR